MKSASRIASHTRLYGFTTTCRVNSAQSSKVFGTSFVAQRTIHSTPRFSVESRNVQSSTGSITHGGNTKERNFEDNIEELKQKQTQTPWHREGSDIPPVRRPRSAGAMVKGKLLTTPSRLLKLTLPLTTSDHNSDRKDVEPLALLVHPHQPLSYLERLIQSELPTISDHKGGEKIPYVYFRAEEPQQDEDDVEEERGSGSEGKHQNLNKVKNEEEIEKTGIIKNDSVSEHGTQVQAEYDSDKKDRNIKRDLQRPDDRRFVRWSSSTEIGDFIRDAAHGKEFAVEIEGDLKEIRVGVPSFGDRTHYLRQRLRRISQKISDMAAVKNECDKEAHRGAQRIAIGGFASLVSWWALVAYLTFKTDLGWDVMEPVTYLVGLSGLMGGYGFFLYHNREVSYRSALNMTISARQIKLYKLKGFDHEKWESLVHEGNELRREIRIVANEYDVDWSEQDDVSDRAVAQALRKDREKKRASKEQDNDDKEEDIDISDNEDEETEKAKKTD